MASNAEARGSERIAAGVRVVIVEDHPLYAEMVKIALERTGSFDVVGVCAGGAEALEVIAREKPDVALIDVRLPSSDEGILVARNVGSISPKTKVVMLTGSQEPHHVHEVMRGGIDGYLTKGIGIRELAPAVLSVLADLAVFSKPAIEVLLSERASSPCPLSEEQLRLLRLSSTGCEINEIGIEVGASRSKVNKDLSKIQGILGVENRTQAIVNAVRNGWI